MKCYGTWKFFRFRQIYVKYRQVLVDKNYCTLHISCICDRNYKRDIHDTLCCYWAEHIFQCSVLLSHTPYPL
jgi:hypothetical protein